MAEPEVGWFPIVASRSFEVLFGRRPRRISPSADALSLAFHRVRALIESRFHAQIPFPSNRMATQTIVSFPRYSETCDFTSDFWSKTRNRVAKGSAKGMAVACSAVFRWKWNSWIVNGAWERGIPVSERLICVANDFDSSVIWQMMNFWR